MFLFYIVDKPCANSNSNLTKYVDICRGVADMHNLTYVDLFNDMLSNQVNNLISTIILSVQDKTVTKFDPGK